MLSFRLSDDFVEQYRERVVPWGFKDAAGNSVGEITFLRTYSRKKADGTKERWWEVCRRVVEGTFSIQKDHVKDNRLPWNDRKAQATAQDMFERMFTFKWTPPGRGLWMMGTPLVNEHKNSAALQNCFAGDERFITRHAVLSLEEAANTGGYYEVWTRDGWAKAEARSFGVQPVQRVTLKPAVKAGESGYRAARTNHEVTLTVTPDHRWELMDGSLTTDLQVGQFIPAAVAETDDGQGSFCRGYDHGFVFGDGSMTYEYAGGDFRYELRLCGAKAQHLVMFAADHQVTRRASCGEDPIVTIRSSSDLKALPSGADAAYVDGFITAWLHADGSLKSNGAWVLTTQNQAAYGWLQENAAFAGYLITGHSIEDGDTNFGPRSAPLHKITLTRFADFRAWKVSAIEPAGEQEVFCAVVPEVERFTLASGIYTSNCAFVSTADMTKYDPAGPFTFLMEASMLGVGVGFDTKGADKQFTIQDPHLGEDIENYDRYVIPDTREGWVESTRMLIESHLMPGKKLQEFDYAQIRPAGAPIKTFGGTAAGPEPLMRLHNAIRDLFRDRAGQKLTSIDILDLGNLIGVCVVSGNVRRSAELAIGTLDDKSFLDAKNYGSLVDTGDEAGWYDQHGSYMAPSDYVPTDEELADGWQARNATEWMPGPAAARSDWGWMSNNSVAVNVGDDLTPVVEGIARNGEPGVIWLDQSRRYGRLIDPPNNKDHRVAGYNPCAEQSLESYEMCTLVETYIGRHESLEDFKRTLKVAYLYAKTVTLLPTHWQRTNAIMQRNRRIGTSMSGIANFADNYGVSKLREWMDEGYKIVQSYDAIYSEWLCVRESIKTTTVKPSGTVSILAGESPGVHWGPGGEYFDRGIVFSESDPMVQQLRWAGYNVEESAYTKGSVFVQFPIHSTAKRSEGDVTLFEKASLAVLAQRYWSDNSVSVTLSFDKEAEGQHVGTVLNMHEGELKTVSFLPKGNETYAQMPYQQIDADQYEAATMRLMRMDLTGIYAGLAADAIGEQYCTTDACEIKTVTDAAKLQVVESAVA